MPTTAHTERQIALATLRDLATGPTPTHELATQLAHTLLARTNASRGA